MANLTPASGGYRTGITRLETTDYATGGESGNANKQAKELLANDIALKDEIEVNATKLGAYQNVFSVATGSEQVIDSTFNGCGIVASIAAGFSVTSISHQNFPAGPSLFAGVGSMSFFCTGTTQITKEIGTKMTYTGTLASGSMATGSEGVVSLVAGDIAHLLLNGDLWFLFVIRA